jgi:hypothetical protein
MCRTPFRRETQAAHGANLVTRPRRARARWSPSTTAWAYLERSRAHPRPRSNQNGFSHARLPRGLGTGRGHRAYLYDTSADQITPHPRVRADARRIAGATPPPSHPERGVSDHADRVQAAAAGLEHCARVVPAPQDALFRTPRCQRGPCPSPGIMQEDSASEPSPEQPPSAALQRKLITSPWSAHRRGARRDHHHRRRHHCARRRHHDRLHVAARC